MISPYFINQSVVATERGNRAEAQQRTFILITKTQINIYLRLSAFIWGLKTTKLN